MGKYTGKKCRLLTMMWLTGFFFFVEIIVGYVTNSMALVADSFHMLGDIAALVISFLSVKVSGNYHQHLMVAFVPCVYCLSSTFACKYNTLTVINCQHQIAYRNLINDTNCVIALCAAGFFPLFFLFFFLFAICFCIQFLF